MLIIAALFGILIGRLFFMQMIDESSAKVKEDTSTKTKTVAVPATRGNIYDCKGVLLAYNDLQYNLDARYGQVYMIEGVVHQVLSQNPLTVVICTGEDGVSQPVVVECPEQRSFSLEEGESCRIYADVSSALFILPVLTGRYMFYAPFAAPEEAGN